MPATVTFDPVANPVAAVGSPFTLTGRYTNPPFFADKVDNGAFAQVPASNFPATSIPFTYPHAGIATAGAHNVTIEIGVGGPTATVAVNIGSAVATETLQASVSASPIAGSSMSIVAALGNATAIPALYYRLDNGAQVAMTGVTLAGATNALTAPAAGSHTIVVFDDGDHLQATVNFTVAAVVTPPPTQVIITPSNGLTISTPQGTLAMQTAAQGSGVILAGAVIAGSGQSQAATYLNGLVYAQENSSPFHWYSYQGGWNDTESATLPGQTGGGGTTNPPPPAGTRVSAPDNSAVPGTWIVNQSFPSAVMPHGFMRYDYLPPHNFTPSLKYPLLVIILENDEGDSGGSYPSDGTGMVMQTEVNGSVNTTNFRRLHPCGVLVLHIDQTIDESGQNANANGGGYGDAPDSGGNEQTIVALIKSLVANTAQYSIDPTAILGRGSSLGGIAMAAEIEDNNIATGGSNALFSGVMTFSDQLYRPNIPNGPAVFEKFRNVGFIACSTPNDNSPDSIDGPAWLYFSGNKPYPTPATYTAGGAAAIRASALCKFYYIRMSGSDGMPWDRYSRLNEDGGEGTQLWATLFGFMG